MVLNLICEELPYYMLPSDIKAIKSFPLNMNDKIDKQKLIELYINNELQDVSCS